MCEIHFSLTLSVSFQDNVSTPEATEEADDDELIEEGDGQEASTNSSGAADKRCLTIGSGGINEPY